MKLKESIASSNDEICKEFSKLKERDYKLYSLTIKFKYSKRMFTGWSMNTDLMYSQINWLFSRISRDLFYRPKEVDMLWWGGPHYNKSDLVKGVHAHFTIAVKEANFRSKYRDENSFHSYLKDKEQAYLQCSFGEGNLMNGFWIGSWDGSVANITYNTRDVVDLHDLWLLKTKVN